MSRIRNTASCLRAMRHFYLLTLLARAGVRAAGGGIPAERRARLHQQRVHVDGGRARREESRHPPG